MGVEPRKTMAHRAMTRPRMAGVEWSCSSELAVAMKTTLAAPMGTSRITTRGSDGATATATMNAPNSGVTTPSRR